jgi:hypothetical protein
MYDPLYLCNWRFADAACCGCPVKRCDALRWNVLVLFSDATTKQLYYWFYAQQEQMLRIVILYTRILVLQQLVPLICTHRMRPCGI